MRTNVSTYILAVNETINNNMTSLTSGFTNQTYVDNVNTSMRANVSTYVIAVNNTQMINTSVAIVTAVNNANNTQTANTSAYILAVNETIKNNMTTLTSGFTNQTYVDNVNTSM